jgi:hypothetical protein
MEKPSVLRPREAAESELWRTCHYFAVSPELGYWSMQGFNLILILVLRKLNLFQIFKNVLVTF